MAAITSAVLSIGSMAYKGFSAIDAAKSQSREAGRLTEQADELERNALADIEQNRLEAVQAPMQIFDTTNELQTLDGSTILETAAEGDQRGVQATAGKIKGTQDAARTEARDTIAKVQLELETNAAKEGNRKGELASEYKTDQAIEMSLEADAMQKNADSLEAAGVSNLVDAGVGAFSAVNTAFGSKAGNAAKDLMDADPSLSKTDALKMANEQGLEGKTGVGKLLAKAGQGISKYAGLAAEGLSNFTGIGDGKDFSKSGISEAWEDIKGLPYDELLKKAEAAGMDIKDFILGAKKNK
tara:strand:- start:380 stop:1273 length:894 start_codon:yes stop_codon:yes gene_type:complete